ncbi:hypothetical protein [Nocardia sp. CA-135398]|uniref:hypothetical protein n=1 Tax=Nocardia sp. CA-135398 TaxID=3239977 RepID=UPI003D95D296
MPASEVVIVSGAEYAKYEPGAGDKWVLRPFTPSIFIAKVRNWAANELRIADTTVTVFDIARGTQETTTDGRTWKRVRTLPPPTNDEYWRIVANRPGSRRYTRPANPFTNKDIETTHLAYLPGSAVPPRTTLDDSYRPVGGPRLGMQDVYNYICRLGITRPATLRGLHIFAHADEGGPILLDTWSPAPDADDRGPLDIDARAHQDFTAANIPGVGVPTKFADDVDRERFIADHPRTRSGFLAAWTEDATAVVWGCLHDDFVKAIIEQAAAQLARYAAQRSGATPADPEITFRPDASGSLAGADVKDWAAFFALPPPRPRATAEVRPLSWLKAKLISLNDNAYAGQLRVALAAGTTYPHRRVLAAPVGVSTWVNPSKRDTGINALMRVVPGEFDKVLTFYKSLGYTYALDLADDTKPFGRGYGQFPPSAPTP